MAITWLFVRFVRRMVRLARSDQSADGYVAFANAAAIAAFAVGMFTYDAFAFTQVTLVAFVVLGLGVSHSLVDDRAAAAVGARSRYLASAVSVSATRRATWAVPTATTIRGR